MIHDGVSWKHQLGGESLAVCGVRKGCSKGELQVKRGWAFQHETTKAALHGREMPRRWGGGGRQFAAQLYRTPSSSGLSPSRPDLLACEEGPPKKRGLNTELEPASPPSRYGIWPGRSAVQAFWGIKSSQLQKPRSVCLLLGLEPISDPRDGSTPLTVWQG